MLYNVGPKSRKKTHFGTFLRFFTFFLEGIQTQNPKKTNVYYSIYLAGLRFKNTSANTKQIGMCDLFFLARNNLELLFGVKPVRNCSLVRFRKYPKGFKNRT